MGAAYSTLPGKSLLCISISVFESLLEKNGTLLNIKLTSSPKEDVNMAVLLLATVLLVYWDAASAAVPACETMTSCELFAEIQEHSKLIAGFSYNVKKADNALTQLRSEKISLTNRVVALEEELKEGENDTVLLTNQEALNKLTLQDKELETGIENLSDKLEELKEEVKVIFDNNINNNDKDLVDLQTRLIQLNEQVKTLNDIVRNHTENFGLINSPENPENSQLSDKEHRQVSAMKAKHNRLEIQVNEINKVCGTIDSGGASLDSLGIELETVKSSYDTLQDQVTELEQRCQTQNEQLEKLLEEMEKKLEKLEKNEKNYGEIVANDTSMTQTAAKHSNNTVATVAVQTKPFYIPEELAAPNNLDMP